LDRPLAAAAAHELLEWIVRGMSIFASGADMHGG
jgi:hypothetical protein